MIDVLFQLLLMAGAGAMLLTGITLIFSALNPPGGGY